MESADVTVPENHVLRVMFYNIYGYKWYPDKEHCPHLHSGPVSLRQKMEAELIERYAPDVLGMEEYCAAFHKGMTPLLNQAGYTQVDEWYTEPDQNGNRINFTPLFYKADRLRVLRSGYYLYSGPNDVQSKSLTWTIFEEAEEHKRFITVCTHFMYNDPKLTAEEQNRTRVENARQLLTVVDQIEQLDNGQFSGISVIMGGDLNCLWGSEPFQTLQDNGFQWLYDIAQTKNDSSGIKQYATYDELVGEYIIYPTPVDDPHRAIDHMMIRQGTSSQATVLSYLAVTDREACLCSDHCPRIAEMILS